ncbi:MAG: hypothetical protein CR982_07720 [Candidatus Cloacimonadota bacterium]|nr:MAG: hypothetical protein CR982_07720 [Candidatus Cloacimonadota bacterium]PIE78257.1 MAG: hypothetical protein CSA15_08820 [Candidatus Delongbacteria bacterium]
MNRVLLFLIMTVSIFGMEKYDRKSISVTKMSVSDKAAEVVTLEEVRKGQYELMERLRTLGRFDFNPIPSGINDPKRLFEIVKEYTETKIDERAERQWDIKNDFYGSNFISGENVDKIINGTYLFFPKLTLFTMVYDKDKNEYSCALEMKMKVYSAINKGTPENPNWEPKLIKEIEALGSNYNPLTGGSKNRKDASSLAYLTMLELMVKELKTLDQFKIKAILTKADVNNDKLTFDMGMKVGGIKIDDSYLVGYRKKKGGKDIFVETGYMKVRKVNSDESEAQLLIVTNPKDKNESELYTEYDQVIEYPKMGLNAILSFGITGFRGWGEDYFINSLDKDDEYSYVSAFSLTGEYGLGRNLSISELYAVANIEYNLLQDIKIRNNFNEKDEFSFSAFTYELGLRKKFYKRRSAFVAGVLFSYFGLGVDFGSLGEPDTDINPNALTEDCYSYGGKLELGYEYLISKDLFLQLMTGYRFMLNLTNSNGNEVGDSSGDQFSKKFYDDKFYTPNGFIAKLSIGYNI